MPDWKNIARLSDKDEKAREAQFEAEMRALIAQDPSQPPGAPAPVPPVKTSPAQTRSASVPLAVVPAPSSPTIIPLHDGIQISVTANGQTTQFQNLESVPGNIRQQIMSVWIGSPATNIPPIYNFQSSPTAPAKPQNSKRARLAMFLNLIIPGAGQFYLGQRGLGAFYALTFLASFVAMLVIFGRGYSTYLRLSTSGDILDPGNLEQLTQAFNTGTIGTLAAIGTLIYLASAVHLAVSRHRKEV